MQDQASKMDALASSAAKNKQRYEELKSGSKALIDMTVGERHRAMSWAERIGDWDTAARIEMNLVMFRD